MQEDDNQIVVPPSFVQVHSDARGRLRERVDALRARYELCEDLASHLVEQAQLLYHREGASETGVLAGIHAGLCTGEAGVSVGEARWITLRLAELLAWRSPDLPPLPPPD
ncbi:hypothetical protein SAMN05428957_107130 [Oryzisolibacter propanilivorax]|uniref:Uncharacterized protein n=1 Tax=Oryzisolibacter propanilivorax TaxID=1527607 RepID=A0A1G9U2R6_9BURK|nr:hypothetical protein [Oryzisolibacter propanilivorax]SDM53914.1 hypothetical protein SAMN05428957_107130 [Oryzisolibacter propanilivorax]